LDSLGFGVTTVGDISANPAVTRPVFAGWGLSGVRFGEVMGMAGRRGQLAGRLAAAVSPDSQTEFSRNGVEPHAPYSIDLPGIRQCVEAATAGGLPLAMHLSETAFEEEFLRRQTGEFRRLWEALGAWQTDVPTFPGSPVEMARAVGLLDYPTVLAHVNYASDADLELLAAGRASVVYCPRTHAYFGHPPHRFAEMLARGINVAVGTDSTASSPDLDLMAEMRLIRALRPEVGARAILEMGTVRGARALGMEGQVGSLAAGRRADWCAFRVGRGDPLEAVLADVGSVPVQGCLAGRRARAG